MRYVNLSSILAFTKITTTLTKKFPTYDSFVEKKILLPHEVAKYNNNFLISFIFKFYSKVKQQNINPPKYFVLIGRENKESGQKNPSRINLDSASMGYEIDNTGEGARFD